MQPNPKKVRRNEDKDYAEIYQENFLAQNDPAPLGQAAYNRQLSAGIRKRIGQDRLAANPISKEKPVVQLPPKVVPFESSEFDVERGEAFRNPVQRGPGRFGIDSELESGVGTYSGNVTPTQSGYTQADPITRQRAAEQRAAQGEVGLTGNVIPSLSDMSGDPNIDRLLGLQAQRDAREQQIRQEVGVFPEIVDPSDYNTSRKFGLDAYNEAVREAEIQADLLNARNRELQERYEREQIQQEAQRRAQQRAAQGEVGLTGSTIPTLEEMTGIMPSELGTPSERLQYTPDYTGAGLQTPKTTEELEAELDAAVEAGTGFIGGPGAVKDPTPDPYDGPEDDETDDDGNAITLSGATASYDNGITREEQRLSQQLDAEENAVLQEFNQKYNQFIQLAVNRGAVRGSLESQGFTGGIGQQIQDFLSTQEMLAFNQLISEKDQALEAIRLERNNIPNAAKTNYLQSLELENASIQAQTAFSQMISQKVLDGSMSLQEANSLAQEYGIQDVQSVFQTAIEAQIASGEMNKAAAKAELERLGLDTSFLDKVGGGNDFTNFSLTPEAAELEEEIKNILNETGMATEGGGMQAARVGVVLASTAIGAKIGTFIPIPVVGTVVGALAGAAVGIASQYGASNIDSGDFTKAGASLFKTNFMLEQGAAFMSGQYESISISKPAGQSTAFGGLDSTYVVNMDGKEYQLQGSDIAILATVLKKKGYSRTDSRYEAIFTTASKAVKDYDTFGSLGAAADTMLGNKYFVVTEMYEAAFK